MKTGLVENVKKKANTSSVLCKEQPLAAICIPRWTFARPPFSFTRSSASLPLQELKETEELDIQLKVFNENKEEDSIELSHRLEDIRAEMEYPFAEMPSNISSQCSER